MGDGLNSRPVRGTARTAVWQAVCKDCRAERAESENAEGQPAAPHFEYSSAWAERAIERGETRSDRCQRHRRDHRDSIRALAVPYVDLRVIGQVADTAKPTGPLGGLGPLPVLHREQAVTVDLSRFEFGMSDQDILEICEGLRTKRVAVIEAGTGTGKSTFMPFRLMSPPANAPFRLRAHGPIIVTEPRLAAATGVARFVGEELCFGHDSRACGAHVGPGYPVGYQVRGQKQWDAACDLIYVTDGTMINWLRDGQLSRIGAVIVDEAHERSENIDIILAHLRDSVQHHKHLRVIITSATLDPDFFVHYFGGPDAVFHHYVPATKSFGYGVPFFVGLEVNDDVIARGAALAANPGTASLTFEGWSRWGPEDPQTGREDLHATTRSLAPLRCATESPVDRWKDSMVSVVAEQVVKIAAGTTFGDILAFLPTTEKIEDAVGQIASALAKRGLSFDVYPLLSSTDRAISEKAIAGRSRGEKRKIVVSSNLAETSLTVKGVRYVVDSGLICQPTWDPKIASGSFPVVPHSQSGLRQRWGRVGRDAPGWVFPLYTPAQFLGLPRNTPPGSTQTNLEVFYMKLMSAGMDVERAALPANFVHEQVTRDEDGLRSMATFTAESVRAKRALLLSGAADRDGHLTEFGRNLERFPGEGSHALAIMLADQLACVHEVALAVHVLGRGELYGHKDGRILQASRDWPPAWRVEAARRHRALVAGCIDDLDAVIRVFSEWQRAKDRGAWCATWWVNDTALQASVEAVLGTIALLSPGMRGEAVRPFVPELAHRARAALTRAMMSMRYERVEGSTYRLVDTQDAEVVKMSQNVLVDVPDRVLALHRFRPGAGGDDGGKTAIVSHVVRVAPWAEVSADRSAAALGLQLVTLAAEHRRTEAPAADRLEPIRDRLPVGATVVLAVGGEGPGPRAVERVQLDELPFPRPRGRTTSDAASTGDAPSGFDRDWDLHAAPDPRRRVVDDEEPEDLDLTDAEANDDPAPHLPAATADVARVPAAQLFAAHTVDTLALPTTLRARIVGYRIHGKSPGDLTLVVEQRASGEAEPRRTPSRVLRVSEDPALHSDLADGEVVGVQVFGMVRDHEREWLQLARRDGRGVFYLEASTPGIAISYRGPKVLVDGTFLRRLHEGVELEALILRDDKGVVSASVLPWATACLRLCPTDTVTMNGEVREFLSATVVSPPNEWQKVVVEVDHPAEAIVATPQFEVRVTDLQSAGVRSVEVGRRLLIWLAPDRAPSRLAIRVDDESARTYGVAIDDVVRIVEAGGWFSYDGSSLRAGKAEIPLEVARTLAALGRSAAWKRAVWTLYLDSLYVAIREIRPHRYAKTIEVSPVFASLARTRRRDVAKAIGSDPVVAAVNRVELTGDDEATVERSVTAIRAFEAQPRVCALLPPNTAGMVIGKEHTNRLRLEGAADVNWVWVEHERVHVVGRTGRAVARVVADVSDTVGRAMGELSVPAGKMGILIGTGGSTIKALRSDSGCRRVDNDRTRGVLVVEGPTQRAVERFFALAKGRVPGCSGRITGVQGLNVVEDTTGEGQPRGVRCSGPAADEDVSANRPGCPLAAMFALAISAMMVVAFSILLP